MIGGDVNSLDSIKLIIQDDFVCQRKKGGISLVLTGKSVISPLISLKKPGPLSGISNNLSTSLIIDLSHNFVNNPPLKHHRCIHRFGEKPLLSIKKEMIDGPIPSLLY
jgi:hypothetical protein